jgi:hypothetical protein
MMVDNLCLKVDGRMIKNARAGKVAYGEALRIIRPGQSESRAWGATVSGVLHLFRVRTEDDFQIEVQGDFRPGCPEPAVGKAWPVKHIYIDQGRRKYLDAIVARCDEKSWYAHDIKIIGCCQIVYDRRGKGLDDNVQLWIQTQGSVVNLAEPWVKPVQRKTMGGPHRLNEAAPASGRAISD